MLAAEDWHTMQCHLVLQTEALELELGSAQGSGGSGKVVYFCDLKQAQLFVHPFYLAGSPSPAFFVFKPARNTLVSPASGSLVR